MALRSRSRVCVAAAVLTVAVVLSGCSSGANSPTPTTTVPEYKEPSPAVWPSAAQILAGMAAAEDLPLVVTPLTAENDPWHEVGTSTDLQSKAYGADSRLADRTQGTEPMSVQGGAYVWVYDSVTRANFAMDTTAIKYQKSDVVPAPMVFVYGPIVVAVSGVLSPQDRPLYSAALNEYIASIS